MTGEFEAVIVGAGPVGLLAAVELTLGGARVVVLDRLEAPSQVAKALGVGPIGSEALQRRGMGPALTEAETRAFAARSAAGAPIPAQMPKSSGHFAGLFLRRDPQDEPERRMRLVDQQAIEAMLTARAEALGIIIRRGCALTGFVADDSGVTLTCESVEGADRLRCAFLVGCDGGRSAVRKGGGFAFPGTPPTMTMVQATVDLDHPEHLMPVGWHRTPRGVFSYGAFPNRLFMLDFSGPPADRDAPVTQEEVETLLRQISGCDVRVVTLHAASRWTDNTRLVDSYRRGRVLLAGDAAHVHSPFGGQGLSLGLGDAANLGWKLAAVLRGALPDTLLDTYTAERRPVAEAVLANTLAQAALMRPDPQSGALRAMMATLFEQDDVTRQVGATMRGLTVRYDLGSSRPEVGRLAADRPVQYEGETTSLYALMQDGGGVWLEASSSGTLSGLARTVGPILHRAGTTDGPSLLIRPDGCVAWAGDDGDRDGLEAAIRRWFGTDTAHHRGIALAA